MKVGFIIKHNLRRESREVRLELARAQDRVHQPRKGKMAYTRRTTAIDPPDIQMDVCTTNLDRAVEVITVRRVWITRAIPSKPDIGSDADACVR